MKFKRIFTIALCLALFFTSSGFTINTYGMEGAMPGPLSASDISAESVAAAVMADREKLAGEEEGNPASGNAAGSPDTASQGGSQPTVPPGNPESPRSDGSGNTQPTAGPDNTETSQPTANPDDSGSAQPTANPGNQGTPQPTTAPDNPEVPQPGDSESPQPTADPGNPEGPQPTVTPGTTESPQPSASPTPGSEAVPSVSPAPTDDGTAEGDAPDSQDPDGKLPEKAPLPETVSGNALVETEADSLKILSDTSAFFVDENGVLKVNGDINDLLKGTITIPAEASTIPAGLFNHTEDLRYKIEFAAGSKLEIIEAKAFESSGLTGIDFARVTGQPFAIGDDAFQFCNKLETATFPSLGNATVTIGAGAFRECRALAEIDLKSAIKTVGDYAFYNSGLMWLRLGAVESIGKFAFSSCKYLKSIDWGKKINTISDYAFFGCSSLESIGKMSEVGAEAQTGMFGKGIFRECEKLARGLNGDSSWLPVNMTSIPEDMFKDCLALTDVRIPGKIQIIRAGAFAGCKELKSLTVSEDITVIMSRAFENCNKLVNIEIRQKDSAVNKSTVTIHAEAFPYNKVTTISGYDGTVEEYAELRELKFATLFPLSNITQSANVKNGTVKVSEFSDIKQGKQVLVYLLPKNGYRLKANGLSYNNGTGSGEDFTLVGMNGKTAIFSFMMPGQDVELMAEFEKVDSIAELDFGGLSARYNTPVLSGSNKDIKVKPGWSAQVTIYKQPDIVLTPWDFTYTSTNSKVAVVSKTGVITARSEGECVIKATFIGKTSKTVQIKVTVAGEPAIGQMSLTADNLGRVIAGTDGVGTDAQNNYKLYRTALRNESRSFNVNLQIADADAVISKGLMLPVKWEVVDTGIATVAQSTTYDNKNTITFKKGSIGETVITATVLDKSNKNTGHSLAFTVQAVDITPRLVESKLTVNANSTLGTPINLVSVYDYADKALQNLAICEKKTTGNTTTYPESADFDINKKGDRLYIKSLKENPAIKTYKNLYIRGNYGSGSEDFYVALPGIVLTNKALNPTVKLTGSINLFYAGEEAGSVQITQNLKDVMVTRYELSPKANKEKERCFTDDFIIDPESGKITKNDNAKTPEIEMASGNLLIYYDGYVNPVKKTIKVSTANKKPDYILSVSQATANANARNQEYIFQIISKKTKEVLDLIDNSGGSGTKIETVSDRGTTEGLFVESYDDNGQQINSVAQWNAGDDTLKVKLQENKKPFKGKAVFIVKQPTWSQPMKFTFNLSVTSSVPKLKIGSSSLKLNPILKNQAESTQITLASQMDEIEKLDLGGFTYTGSRNYQDEADKIGLTCSSAAELDRSGGGNNKTITVTARIKDDADEIRPGTYTFAFTPKVTFTDGDPETQNPIQIKDLSKSTIKVVVLKETPPQIKLKSGTFSLNSLYEGQEKIGIAYTLSNLPTSGNYRAVPPAGDELNYKPVSAAAKKITDIKEYVNFTVSPEEGMVYASLADKNSLGLNAGTYTYQVSGMKVSDGEQTLALDPFNVSFKIYDDKQAKAALSGTKGTINPIAPESAVTYTVKISNWAGNIRKNADNPGKYDINIEEYNAAGVLMSDAEENFDVICTDGKTVKIMIKGGRVLDRNQKNYRIRVECFLEDGVGGSGTIKCTSNTVTLPIKQAMPKLKTDGTKPVFYAGARGSEQKVVITKTSNKGTDIIGVDWADKTADAWKNAFVLEYEDDPVNSDRGIVTIRLRNPAYIKLNKAMTFNLVIKCQGQMENTAGTKFTVKTTVKK